VIEDDDEQPGDGDAGRVRARQPGQAARPPEDVCEPRRGDRVAHERDVDVVDAAVEERLDRGEAPRPQDDDAGQRDVGGGDAHVWPT
jgi:hypothetical protein